MTMIETAMDALRATVAKARGLNGMLTGSSREYLTNPNDAADTMKPDRRIAGSPDRRIAGSPDRRIAGSPDRRRWA